MMGLSCPISPASLWPPGLKLKDGDNRVSHFPSRGWWQALRLSFPLGHCERMFWDETKWLAGLFQVAHQMTDDSPIVRCVHHQDWEACEQWHVRRSMGQKISWFTSKGAKTAKTNSWHWLPWKGRCALPGFLEHRALFYRTENVIAAG